MVGFSEAPRHHLGGAKTQCKMWEVEARFPSLQGIQLRVPGPVKRSGQLWAEDNDEFRAEEIGKSCLAHLCKSLA